MRDIKTNGRFEFNVYSEKSKNQRRYEEIGKVRKITSLLFITIDKVLVKQKAC